MACTLLFWHWLQLTGHYKHAGPKNLGLKYKGPEDLESMAVLHNATFVTTSNFNLCQCSKLRFTGVITSHYCYTHKRCSSSYCFTYLLASFILSVKPDNGHLCSQQMVHAVLTLNIHVGY